MAGRTARRTPEPQDQTVEGFDVHLTNFEGPFDLLLQLISRRELDVTQVALSQVTDEFIAFVRTAGETWDLDKSSSFLVVAATLLDLKAARLLPGGEVTEPEDIAALEARDLLFARLLQYRAFKHLAGWVAERLEAGESVHWRPGGLEERFRNALPEVELPIGPDGLALLAAGALTPKPVPSVAVGHLHGAQVSVADQTRQVSARLRETGSLTFRALVSGCDRLTTVVRFLAILELFRARQVTFEQAGPLAELTVRWSGADDTEIQVDEYDAQPELEDR